MDKLEFFKKYDIEEYEFEGTGLCWDDLMEINKDYLCEINEFKKLANYTEECLIDLEKVHSIKKRIKDPEHLIEKIIRKRMENPLLDINVQNYKEIITDLIGVRVLHLFKEDWTTIHDYIMRKWNTKETPCANVREGDNGELITRFKDAGCEVKIHPYGYRSVHYLILLPHNKKEITAEIQVRTVFEEAWSEIDHRIRYPYEIDNPILLEYLVIFNRLAGSADEMGSFIKFLKQDLDKKKQELEEKNQIINELQREINNSKLEKDEKERINSSLEKLFISEATKELQGMLNNNAIVEATKELEDLFGNMTIAEATQELQKALGSMTIEEVAQGIKAVLENENVLELIGEKEEPLLLNSADPAEKKGIKLLNNRSEEEISKEEKDKSKVDGE